jgi:HK97 gp10 family phage protein
LEGLAKDLDGKDMSAALLAGARVYARKMRSFAPRRTGRLQESIYAFNAYQSDFSGAKGGRRLRLKLRPNEAMAVASSRVAHLVEFGTKPHRIRPKKRKALALEGGAIVGSVERQAARAHPFWRPALYNGASEASQAVMTAAQSIVEKYD